jgi:hypothetical protein
MGHRTRRAGLKVKLLLCGSSALLIGLLAPGTASAAPPANDNFANAAVLSGTFDQEGGTNVDASKEVGEPDHAGDPGGASIWYRWTAPNSGTYQVNTCLNNTTIDTLLAVYTGSAIDSLTYITSSDQSIPCGDKSVLYFRAVSGTTYHFAVDGWSDGGTSPPATGGIGITVLQETLAPSNDNFASAHALPSQTENLVQGRNVLGTKQTGEPNHAGDNGGASVWYSWVAPASGWMKMDICDSDFYSLLAVYTGSAVNALSPVASTARYVNCELTFNAVQGTVYRIAVDGYSSHGTEPADIGDFYLRTHLVQPPANDNFANAQTISGANVQVSGDNIDAGSEPGEPSGFVDGPLASVWYSWTAPASGAVTMDTCNSDFDTVLTVFTGSSLGSLSRVASNDEASNCGFGGSKLILNVNAGTTYKIAVDGYFDEGHIDLRLVLKPGVTVAQKDSKAPNSKIKKVVVDSKHDKAKVTFGSSESGSKFKCKLDKAKYKSCHSPKTFRHLDEGRHKVKVVATDAAGNTDQTPAVKKFEIDG